MILSDFHSVSALTKRRMTMWWPLWWPIGGVQHGGRYGGEHGGQHGGHLQAFASQRFCEPKLFQTKPYPSLRIF